MGDDVATDRLLVVAKHRRTAIDLRHYLVGDHARDAEGGGNFRERSQELGEVHLHETG